MAGPTGRPEWSRVVYGGGDRDCFCGSFSDRSQARYRFPHCAIADYSRAICVDDPLSRSTACAELVICAHFILDPRRRGSSDSIKWTAALVVSGSDDGLGESARRICARLRAAGNLLVGFDLDVAEVEGIEN